MANDERCFSLSEKQSKIILACFGLHNYMEGLKPRTPGTPMNQWTHAWLAQNSTEDMGRVRDWIKYGVASLQLRYVKCVDTFVS